MILRIPTVLNNCSFDHYDKDHIAHRHREFRGRSVEIPCLIFRAKPYGNAFYARHVHSQCAWVFHTRTYIWPGRTGVFHRQRPEIFPLCRLLWGFHHIFHIHQRKFPVVEGKSCIAHAGVFTCKPDRRFCHALCRVCCIQIGSSVMKTGIKGWSNECIS